MFYPEARFQGTPEALTAARQVSIIRPARGLIAAVFRLGSCAFSSFSSLTRRFTFAPFAHPHRRPEEPGMHRMKIGLIAAIVLLALTAGLYIVVTRELKDAVVQDLDTAVSRAQRIHGDVAQLEAMEFGNKVDEFSHRSAAVGVFDKTDENSRRQAAFEQCEKINSELRTGGKPKADIVALLDASGPRC